MAWGPLRRTCQTLFFPPRLSAPVPPLPPTRTRHCHPLAPGQHWELSSAGAGRVFITSQSGLQLQDRDGNLVLRKGLNWRGKWKMIRSTKNKRGMSVNFESYRETRIEASMGKLGFAGPDEEGPPQRWLMADDAKKVPCFPPYRGEQSARRCLTAVTAAAGVELSLSLRPVVYSPVISPAPSAHRHTIAWSLSSCTLMHPTTVPPPHRSLPRDAELDDRGVLNSFKWLSQKQTWNEAKKCGWPCPSQRWICRGEEGSGPRRVVGLVRGWCATGVQAFAGSSAKAGRSDLTRTRPPTDP